MHIATDIGTALLSRADQEKLKPVMLTKSEKIREEVRAAVILSDPDTADEFANIGISPPLTAPAANKVP
jgi:hypothetical protein